jgi:hypothetical protein
LDQFDAEGRMGSPVGGDRSLGLLGSRLQGLPSVWTRPLVANAFDIECGCGGFYCFACTLLFRFAFLIDTSADRIVFPEGLILVGYAC